MKFNENKIQLFFEKNVNFLTFFGGFSNFIQNWFFFRKNSFFLQFSFSRLETSFASKFIIFFQWKLTSHTLWFEKPIGKRANILARLKLQIYTCEQKIHFLLSKSKIGAFQLALSRNAISTTESKRTPHFWSRTTLVYIHDSWNKF